MRHLITLLLLITFTSCTKEVIEDEFIFITEEVKEDLGHNVTRTVLLTSAMNEHSNNELHAFYITSKSRFRVEMPSGNNPVDLERLEVYTNTNANNWRLELHSVTKGKVAESGPDNAVLYYKFTEDDVYFFKMTAQVKSKTVFTIHSPEKWMFNISHQANN